MSKYYEKLVSWPPHFLTCSSLELERRILLIICQQLADPPVPVSHSAEDHGIMDRSYISLAESDVMSDASGKLGLGPSAV